jgi:hypothetical protein
VGVAFSHDVYAPLLNRIGALEAYTGFIGLDMPSRSAGPLNVDPPLEGNLQFRNTFGKVL